MQLPKYHYYFYPLSNGGTEKYVYLLAKHLLNKFEVRVLSIHAHLKKEYFDKNFDLNWINSNKLFSKKLSKKLKFIEENRFQGNEEFEPGFDGLKMTKNYVITLLFLLFITIIAFLIKNRFSLLAVAILFYLAAHLMESTFIGLELYFEHRNYLAALFLLLSKNLIIKIFSNKKFKLFRKIKKRYV